jgi:hypothetical protein
MQFSPSCNCCGTAAICAMCDEGTTQEEYSLTFWGGEAEESTIIVSNVGHPCGWTYQGVIGDIQGISDDGNGTCDDTTQLDVVVRMMFEHPVNQYGRGWFWDLDIRIQCVTPGQQNRGNIKDYVIISATDPEPETGQTQNCDLAIGVDFTNPVSHNYYSDYGGTCDWPPASQLKIGCLDCSHVGGIYTCNYPGGTFCHMENAP